MNEPAQRITLNPEVCQGKPTLRNMRFTVAQRRQWLASGMSRREVLDDYPFRKEGDVQACLWYTSRIADARSVKAL